MGFLMA